MNDENIVELFFQRDERAIAECQKKYGALCFYIAQNILSIQEDAEECVNDTWYICWNKIPPLKPHSLKSFLGKIVRDIAISKYRTSHAQKRYQGMKIILDELEECIPSKFNVEENYNTKSLVIAINDWLGMCSKDDRILFVKRYYYGESVKNLAKLYSRKPNQIAQKMLKLRKELKKYLENEGVLA